MLSKSYLQCRMERNLMAPDEMKNLGYAEDGSQGPMDAEVAVAGHTKTVAQAKAGGEGK